MVLPGILFLICFNVKKWQSIGFNGLRKAQIHVIENRPRGKSGHGGGQYIIMLKELDLMVLVTAQDNDNTTLQITVERILPAFIK